ncbi:hypothetical protein BGX33_012108 [Mortierella sp. NVP41]|nr:hypothetical protein BGX33_012108 [Mortierella sp. NVP41]
MDTLETVAEAFTRSAVGELSIVLRDVHAQNLAAYDRLLKEQTTTSPGTDNESLADKDLFWDIVVITAGDKQQKHCYQRRIDQKLAQGSIPSRAKYLVIDDPPNSKIGSGGSTCLVMKTLQDKFPADFLLQARTLLIHAGGYSTRLPHVSARGKVFMTLPQADKPEGIQILDLKLVLYLHLLKSMPPGIYQNLSPGCDLEAWADVLSFQDLLPLSSSTPTSSSNHESNPHEESGKTLKQALHQANVQLDVMVLNSSKFYHLGTMQEFISATCMDHKFMWELNIRNRDSGVAIVSSQGQAQAQERKQEQGQGQGQGQGQQTHENGPRQRGPVFFENSHVPATAHIGEGSIVVDTDLPAGVVIPECTCLFTLQLQEHAFASFTFSVSDDMKRAVSATSLDIDRHKDISLVLLKRLKIFENISVLDMLAGRPNDTNLDDNHEHDDDQQYRPPASLVQACGNSLSLWTAPIFEIAQTRHDSTRLALERLARIREIQTGESQHYLTKDINTPRSSILGWVSLKDAARIAREL